MNRFMNTTFKHTLRTTGVGVLLATTFACSSQSDLQLEITNSNTFGVQNAAVSVNLESSKIVLPTAFSIVDSKGTEIPYQLDDLDQNGTQETLFLQMTLGANFSETLSIKKVTKAPEFTTKTAAVIKVRDKADPESMQIGDDFEFVDSYTQPFNFKQDNGLIFLEGPGWESDLVGYRFYFDNRNRFDIFGKKTDKPSLGSITETYHERRDWGADILKVNSSLGIGSPALFQDNKFYAIEQTGLSTLETISNGPLRSIIKVTYPDWTVGDKTMNAVMKLEIHAHHRYTELSLKTDAADDVFATGLVTHKNVEKISISETPDYTFGYTWGNQTDLEEGLGMAVILPGNYSPEYKGEFQDSYVFSLNSQNSEVKYRFLAVWELEPETVRIPTVEKFEEYIDQVAKQWQHPLKVTIKK